LLACKLNKSSFHNNLCNSRRLAKEDGDEDIGDTEKIYNLGTHFCNDDIYLAELLEKLLLPVA
jgi:hypothetical protein